MPYIITTRDAVAANQSKHVDDAGVLRYDADDSEVFPGPTGVRPSVPTTRTAVATLDEARDAVLTAAERPDVIGEAVDGVTYATAMQLPAAGGTIELPDGTVIEVRLWVADDSRTLPQELADRGDIFEMVDAYNAR